MNEQVFHRFPIIFTHQHLLATQIFLFLIYPNVKILPFTAVQVKEATLEGAFTSKEPLQKGLQVAKVIQGH